MYLHVLFAFSSLNQLHILNMCFDIQTILIREIGVLLKGSVAFPSLKSGWYRRKLYLL
jgi:hypothetical protein